MIDVLCKYASKGNSLGETTTERMKNMLLVMRYVMIMMIIMNSMENHFTVMTEVAGQDMMEVTMTMLDSYCPSIRKDLELTLHPQGKEEKKEVVVEEKGKEEEKEKGKGEEQVMNVEKNEQQQEQQEQQEQQQVEEESGNGEKEEEEEEVVVVDGDQEETKSNDDGNIPETLSAEKQEDEQLNEGKDEEESK